MVIIDGPFLLGVAGIITSIASFIKMVMVLGGRDAQRARCCRNSCGARLSPKDENSD